MPPVGIVDRSTNGLERAVTALRRLGASTSGSISTTFALSLLPITLSIGAAVDYSFANNARSHLNAAADAAALSAVASS